MQGKSIYCFTDPNDPQNTNITVLDESGQAHVGNIATNKLWDVVSRDGNLAAPVAGHARRTGTEG